jgi:hypothetical protein
MRLHCGNIELHYREKYMADAPNEREKEEARYVVSWHEYRIIRRQVVLILIVGTPCAIALSLWISERFYHSPIGFLWGGGGWLLTFGMYITTRCQIFKCPRCSQPFFIRYGLVNASADRCGHCGLRKYAPNGDG